MTVDFLSVQWRHAKFLCALSSMFFSATSFSAERLPESLAAYSSVTPFAEISVESADSADQVYLEAEQMPSFPGGVKAMMSYIQKKCRISETGIGRQHPGSFCGDIYSRQGW